MLLVTFIPYLALQVYAAIKCRGWWRVGALLPLAWMVPVGVVSISALREGSNLWPCMLIPASAVTLLYLVILVALYPSSVSARGFEVKMTNEHESSRSS